MNRPRLLSDIRLRLVDSLSFESDTEFRRQMGQLVGRSVSLAGLLGLAALAIFLIGQIAFLGKTAAFSYVGGDPETKTVLWDKLAMFVVFGGLLVAKHFLPDDQPGPSRLAMAIATVALVVVISLDDVAVGNVSFTPAYVALVLLLLAGAVPMRPLMILLTSGLGIGAWYVSLTLLPAALGLAQPLIAGEHVVFLLIIALVSTASSSLLYNVRHEEFLARRSAEKMSESLRAAQDRLIYVEKMASLGRFATGVAHELRNPLNFVLNFATLSVDMLNEAAEESDASHPEADDLHENLKRIHEHAVRADRIVRSLINHSQKGSSHRSLVGVNAFVTEQAAVVSRRHGPDRSGFDLRLDLQLDENAGEFSVFPAELAYAVENILNNAFQAVIDRAENGANGYEPVVTVTTKRFDEYVQIRVRDNGVGIPDDELQKIFEPFYTTRSAGSGTGLGLAAAYAAITEGHGGSIEVESGRDEGSTFTIEVPIEAKQP